VNHWVGTTLDHVVVLALRSEVGLDRRRSDVRRTEAGQGQSSAARRWHPQWPSA